MIEAFISWNNCSHQAVLFCHPERSLSFFIVMSLWCSNEVPHDNHAMGMKSHSNEVPNGNNAMEVKAETTLGSAPLSTALYTTCQYFAQMCCSGVKWIQRNIITKARNLAFRDEP